MIWKCYYLGDHISPQYKETLREQNLFRKSEVRIQRSSWLASCETGEDLKYLFIINNQLLSFINIEKNSLYARYAVMYCLETTECH